MVKRSTWVYMAIFVVLAAVAIYLQRMDQNPASPSGATGTTTAVAIPTTDYIFPAEEGVVSSILIEDRAGKVLGLERQNGTWVATKPYPAQTTPGSVEAAASQITALPIQESLSNLDASAVGLNAPGYTITVGFTSGKFFIVQVGDETPTGTEYYVRKENGPVLVVSKDSLSPILDMLTTPPLVASPTPTAAPPTDTPTVTPIPTDTPAATDAAPTATKTP